jgi:hypothetical protein
LVHFMAIWYILWQFGTFNGNLVHGNSYNLGIFFPVLVYCVKKNLETLVARKK